MANASVIVLARKLSIIGGVLIVAAILGVSAYRSIIGAPEAAYQKQFIDFGGKRFQVEIADTNQKRMKGLGDREGIASDEGMLFVFEQAAEYCFWMKDVDFPLDIYWMDESFEVVESVLSASPDSYPETFCPKQQVKYVLEVSGGADVDLSASPDLQIEHKRSF